MSGGTARPLRVAMIGHGFMGAAHSQGWRTAPHVFDLPADVEMAVIVGWKPANQASSESLVVPVLP